MTVGSRREAYTLAAREDLHAFSLVIMDIKDPAQNAACSTRMACQLLQEWTTAWPLLPFVCIVPASQQHAFLKIRADILRFVTMPVVLPALVEAIAASLPRHTQRVRGFSTPFDLEEMSDRRHLCGQIHNVRRMASSPIPVDTVTPPEGAIKHDEEIAAQVATEDPT